eukprot:7169904-Pyramimonas_sp.AAC.1
MPSHYRIAHRQRTAWLGLSPARWTARVCSGIFRPRAPARMRIRTVRCEASSRWLARARMRSLIQGWRCARRARDSTFGPNV